MSFFPFWHSTWTVQKNGLGFSENVTCGSRFRSVSVFRKKNLKHMVMIKSKDLHSFPSSRFQRFSSENGLEFNEKISGAKRDPSEKSHEFSSFF